MSGTLAGHRITDARVSIPKWGLWYVEASLDGEHALTGAVDVIVADLTLKGTVLSGGAAQGRSHYRVVAGAGGWGKEVPAKGYANDAGVKVATVVADAAQAVGETFDATSVSSSERVGPGYARRAARASLVIEEAAPGNWYVDELGVTKIGARPQTTLPNGITRVKPVNHATRTVELATESVAQILPGVVVDELVAVDVELQLSSSGLRALVWGDLGSSSSRELDPWRKMFEQLFPNLKYGGLTEYRVVSQTGPRLDLQPIRTAARMPILERVVAMPGVAGAKAIVLPGARVLVGFVESDPGRPVVLHFEDAEGNGFVPLALSFCNGMLPTARMGDLAGGIFPIAATALQVLT